jgi:signal transduction histidine kinase
MLGLLERKWHASGSCAADRARSPSPRRITVANWLHSRSISRRLSVFVALIVATVVSGVAYLQIHSFEREIDHDLVDAARLGAQSVAENLGARSTPLDPLDVRDMLHDLIDAEPLIDGIAVLEGDATGQVHVFASTSTEEQANVLALAGRAIRTGQASSERSATTLTFVMPLPQRRRDAVAVRVGLESLLQAREHGLALVLGFALPAILLVTTMVYFTARRLVGEPLTAILGTMQRTAAGDLRARTMLRRPDELGAIGAGLDTMLDQLERFNQSLQERIDEATRHLSLRNAQLAESRHQLLATRESLAQAERVAALGQVAANVAHQAGTPLNLVSGYVQMILEDPRTDERTRARLRTVDTQLQQVTRVLRTMLDRAHPPSGFDAVSIGDIVARVRELVQPRLAKGNIRLETAVDEALPRVRADATQLEMALLNLITNALDAMPLGGTLSIRAGAGPGAVRLEVADTGRGLPREVLDHLFDPWITTKPAGQGSGLGLAIVREVVRSHGGTVSARNDSAGAVVTMDLPWLAS